MRRSPLKRKAPLRSGGPLRRVAMKVRRRDTGPSKATRDLVEHRSQGLCEKPGCMADATDVHHRAGRKMGGRKGEAAARLNAVSNLLHYCRHCHEQVTSPSGEAREEALANGWILLEGWDPASTPVRVAWAWGMVLLDDEGGWSRPGDAAPTEGLDL